MDLDLRPATDVLVVRTFIGILEATPPAYVIDQDCLEIRITADDITE